MTKKLLLTTSILTSVLFADFTLEYKMEGNMKQVVQYKDAQHVMISTRDSKEQNAQLIIGNKRYMVINQNGKKRYMDMDVMMNQMKQLSSAFGGMPKEESATHNSSKLKIIKKGKHKTVAGIKGQVWTVEHNEDGKKERLNIVVTDNKKVVDAVHKYIDAMNQFTQMGGEKDDGFSSILAIKKGYVTIGLEGMELVKFDTSDIDNSVYALPKGMNVGKQLNKGRSGASTVQKPPLCAIVGSHGKAKQLDDMLKNSANGWKKIESATCMNMMKMRAENAIFKKNDGYIHIGLSVNVDGENGMIAKYKLNNLKVSNLQRGKIEGHRYQLGHLEKVGQDAMDIKLPNAMLSLTATKNVKDNLADFAKAVFDLSKFTPVKKSKPSADDALKSLGAMFGGQGENHHQSSGANQVDMQKAGEMLKGLFGN